ncbi:hypothetical protein FPV67DRAFT_1154230 [Lyophyllum atratum]|nr:hypothetical protein FPV67DRAFT_1154230 [Lyophyllum atratum]
MVCLLSRTSRMTCVLVSCLKAIVCQWFSEEKLGSENKEVRAGWVSSRQGADVEAREKSTRRGYMCDRKTRTILPVRLPENSLRSIPLRNECVKDRWKEVIVPGFQYSLGSNKPHCRREEIIM